MKKIKYIWNVSFIYMFFKKHSCPKCRGKMRVCHRVRLISKYSPESHKYSYPSDDYFSINEGELREGYFECIQCGFEMTPLQMKEYEKNRPI